MGVEVLYINCFTCTSVATQGGSGSMPVISGQSLENNRDMDFWLWRNVNLK
jgi:hypothetical protein